MRIQHEYGRDGTKSQSFLHLRFELKNRLAILRERMIIQIYEIQTPEEADAVADLGVDHIGTVITDPTLCCDGLLKEVVRTVQAKQKKSSLIPLFSDLQTICRTLDYYQPDIIHFCDDLTDKSDAELASICQRQRDIASRYPDCAVMRTLPIVRNGFELNIDTLSLAERFADSSDWFLTDTLMVPTNPQGETQPVAGFIGITGLTCDWEMAARLVQHSKVPVILAGGIGPRNVEKGIEIVRPAGVDSCTRTNAVDAEGRPMRFKKDLEKVRSLVAAARLTGKQVASDHRQ